MIEVRISKTKCRLFHKWEEVSATGVNVYSECRRCKSRKVESLHHLYQPINWAWLEENNAT